MRYLLFYFLLIFSTILLNCNKKPNSNEPVEPMQFLWKYSCDIIGFGPNFKPTVFSDSLVYIGGDENLACIRTQNGDLKWKKNIDPSGNLSLHCRKMLIDQNYIYGTHIENIRAWNIQTGEESWELDLPGGSLGTGKNSMYNSKLFIAGGGKTRIIEKFNGIKHTVDLKGADVSAIYYNQKLYCGQGWYEGSEGSGQITCLNAETGDSLWAFTTDKGSFLYAAPVIENNIVYCGTTERLPGAFFALNAQTGELIWQKNEFMTFSFMIELHSVF